MASLPTKIRLEIVTPERLLLSEDVDEITIPGSDGYFGILPGHLPLLTTLGIGTLGFRKGQSKVAFSVSGGFAEVLPDRAVVMADILERPEEIDVQRARTAKERAEKMLVSKEDVDIEQTMAALTRALSRIHVAELK